MRTYILGNDGPRRSAPTATVDAYFGLGADPMSDETRKVAGFYRTFRVESIGCT